MKTPTRPARADRPGHAPCRRCSPWILPVLSAVIVMAATGLPAAPTAAPGIAWAQQGATPTPLPTLSTSSLPDKLGRFPRPEPFGKVVVDASADTTCSPNTGESPVGGAMVRLKNADAEILRQQMTNSYGLYDLWDDQVELAGGSYLIEVLPPAGGGLGFRCAKQGSNQAQQQQPASVTLPGQVPADLTVNFELQ